MAWPGLAKGAGFTKTGAQGPLGCADVDALGRNGAVNISGVRRRQAEREERGDAGKDLLVKNTNSYCKIKITPCSRGQIKKF